jgi:hypothetical protein
MPGDGPQSFSLGTKNFDPLRFEVPEGLSFRRKTLGGTAEIPARSGGSAQRVSQTLGVVVDTIKFEAWFVGDDAEDQTRQLEAMQAQQNVLTFAFGTRSFDVVIFDLVETYKSINEIAYAIELEPQFETSAYGVVTVNNPGGDLAATFSDIASVPPITLPATDPALSKLPTIQAAQAAAGSATPSGMSVSSLVALATTLQAGITAAKALMALKQNSTTTVDVGAYLWAAQLAGKLAACVATMGTATGATLRPQVNPGGMNVHQLAVRYTGDIENTDTILAANGISDPFAVPVGPIVIPPGL